MRKIAQSGAAVAPVSEALLTGVGGFTFTGPARYLPDWEGTWLNLDANEPGFRGGRRVKNLFLNSDAPASWLELANGSEGVDYTTSNVAGTLPDGSSGTVKQVAHDADDTNTPFWYESIATARRRSLFALRAAFKWVSGTPPTRFTPVARTNGSEIGSESHNPSSADQAPAATGAWKVLAETALQFESHKGFSSTLGKTAVAGTYHVAQLQFEDVSGRKTAISSEYVPSGATAGIEWFTTEPSVTHSWGSPVYATYNASNAVLNPAGYLTEGVAGAALDVKGLGFEPAATNLLIGHATPIVGYNIADQMGEAVLDGVNQAPGVAGQANVYIDPRSMRLIYNASDITIAAAAITSTTTDLTCGGKLRVGHSFWLHVAGVGQQGPFVVGSFTGTTTLNFTGGTGVSQAGNKNLHRCPTASDKIGVRRNNDSWHYSSVSSVTIPVTGAVAIDGYQHIAMLVTMADILPADGIHAGDNTNNNQPVYYWTPSVDINVTPSGGTGPTIKLVEDWEALRAVGLGYLCRTGFVYELYGGTSGTASFDFVAAAGVSGRKMAVQVVAKRQSGSSTPYMQVSGYGSPTNLVDAAYTRRTWTNADTASVGTGRTLRVNVPANTTVRLIAMQIEDSAAGTDTANATSPIVVGTTTTGTARAATRATRDVGVNSSSGSTRATGWKVNDYTVSLQFTPGAGTLAQTQTLWSVYVDASNYLAIELAGTTLRARRRVGGVNKDATTTLTPVAGTTYAIVGGFAASGVTISLDGVAGTPHADTSDLAIVSTSAHDVGSLNGTQVAFGSIRNLRVD